MRMPCSVSCNVSIMRVPPVNWLRAIVQTRRISLRSMSSAGGATTKPNNDISGSCITITVIEADQRQRDRGRSP